MADTKTEKQKVKEITDRLEEGLKEFSELIIGIKAQLQELQLDREMEKRAKEPIEADDVIVKLVYENGELFEIDRITNKTPEEVRNIMEEMLERVDDEWDSDVEKFLEDHGVEYIPIIVNNGKDILPPQFYDLEVNLETEEVTGIGELSAIQQAESIINRLEHGKGVFSPDERNLIVNYGYKLDDYGKTKELADMLAYRIENEPANAALTVIDAQAEIDALPDGMIGLSQMHEYGYTWGEMLPLTKETALELFDRDLTVYQLHEDGSETLIEGREQITEHDGIFGIEKDDWENEKNLRNIQAELEESGADKEAQLLYGSSDKYGIYQLKDNPELAPLHFMGTDALKRKGIIKDSFDVIKAENYDLIYIGELEELKGRTQGETLEAIFEKFNIDRPADYKSYSLSVSDIVVLHENGKNSTHFVDSFGFTGLPDFIKTQEKENTPKYIYKVEANPRSDSIENRYFLQAYEAEGRGKAVPRDVLYVGTPKKCRELMRRLASGEMTQGDVKALFAKEQGEQAGAEMHPAVYRESLGYASEHGEREAYRASRKLDMECKKAIEDAIRQNFDGMYLNHEAAKPLVDKYGSERMAFVLANTLRQESWDGRFSKDNKAWASEVYIPENTANGTDLNCELIVSSHPAVLDGFIDLFRKEVMEREKEADISNPEEPEQEALQEETQYTSGHNDQKSEPEQSGVEQSEPEQTQAEQPEPQAGQNETEKSAETSELEDMDDGDEIIDLGDEREQVLAEMKKSLEDSRDTSGHDDQKPEQAEPEKMAETEKVEEASRIVPESVQSSVVADFKAKTNELFHEISEMNPAEIEETVKFHVWEKLDECGMDAVIVDAAVVGSRCRGLEKDGADLDVVVELSTNEREDDLFGIFNGDRLHIGEVAVDINPITAQRTGTLETYLPQAEDYLENLRKARESEKAREGEQEKAGTVQDKPAGRVSLKERLAQKKAIVTGQTHENQEKMKKTNREM